MRTWTNLQNNVSVANRSLFDNGRHYGRVFKEMLSQIRIWGNEIDSIVTAAVVAATFALALAAFVLVVIIVRVRMRRS